GVGGPGQGKHKDGCLGGYPAPGLFSEFPAAVSATCLDEASDTQSVSRHTRRAQPLAEAIGGPCGQAPRVVVPAWPGVRSQQACDRGLRRCLSTAPRPGLKHPAPRGPPRSSRPNPFHHVRRRPDMLANAELTANGHPGMTSASLALAAVLMDESTGAGGNNESLGIELLQRATRDDYDRWLNAALAAGGCV